MPLGWGIITETTATAGGQRSNTAVKSFCCLASTFWEIMWPLQMFKTNSTRVFAITLRVFREVTRLIYQPYSPELPIRWNFLTLRFTPFTMLTKSSWLVCLFLAMGNSVGGGGINCTTCSLILSPSTDFLSPADGDSWHFSAYTVGF
jgi:hypothetical protein